MKHIPNNTVAFVLVLAAGAFIMLMYSPDTSFEGGPAIVEVSDSVSKPTVLGESDMDTGEVHPVSYAAMREKQYDGSNLVVGEALAETASYTRYYITYQSGELTISGIMNVPKGDGPFPALVLNHGHIDISVYTNGRGLKREQDYFTRNGYVVLHTDYRNHAQSETDDRDTLAVRLAYAEDAINAVYALQRSGLSYIDADKIGMLGHSMGGEVTLGSLVSQPGLVDAAVLYAPVSGDMRRSYERWISRESNNIDDITELYGSPDESPAFWDGISSETFYDQITTPIRIYHGTADDSVPIDWSYDTLDKLQSAGVDADLTVYDGEAHEFGPRWTSFMDRSREFFDQYLK